jgi:hypothetical protein
MLFAKRERQKRLVPDVHVRTTDASENTANVFAQSCLVAKNVRAETVKTKV